MSEKANFSEVGKLSLKTLFEIDGTLHNLILIFEQDGIIIVQHILVKEVEDAKHLHMRLLNNIVELVRRLDLFELFVGYEGFYLMEDGAVRVLIGTFYSDDEEQVWLAQIHGRTVGEWQDISDNSNRLGFEGLFKRAKAYRWN